MKITVDVDCTPEEARAFFGLPDVQPMQKAVMEAMQEKMLSNMQAMEPEALMKTWFPAQVEGMEQLQKMFWGQMAKGFGGGQE